MKSWASDISSCGVNEDWLARMGELLPPTDYFDPVLRDIVESLRNGINISLEQGIELWNYPNLSVVASLATACKQARFGDQVFFNSNLHVNQTNICTLACKFCAFRRGPKAKDALSLIHI